MALLRESEREGGREREFIFEHGVNCPLLSSVVERHFQGRDVGVVIPSHNCQESIYGLPLSD